MELQVVQDRVEENCWELLEQWQEKQFLGRWAGKRKKKRGDLWMEILGAYIGEDW